MISRGKSAGAAKRRGDARRYQLALLLALLATLVVLTETAAADTLLPFRLCADPGNLPFSDANPETPGLYIELGRDIAARLGRRFEPVWTPTDFARRAIRTTLLTGRCDGFVGLPDDPDFMGPSVVLSKPILTLGYALVLHKGVLVTSFSDLVGQRVAVQFASPPQSLLATHSDVQLVTVLSPEEAMEDLARHDVDVAFIWGPSAGWIAKTTSPGEYDILPVAGAHLQWRTAIGFARDQAALRDAVDRELDALSDRVHALMETYGFPNRMPIELAAAQDAAPGPSAMPASSATSLPPVVDTQQSAAGHKLFNDNCSHCHGPDAIQGERRINLRLLQRKYGAGSDQVFRTTVTQGRVTKGMPKWSGILTDEEFASILAFLHSVQEP
jgi:mono/diheme cytochrome c family protein